MGETFKPGDTVVYRRTRRRYVVVAVNQFGQLLLVALSGEEKGCNPTQVVLGALEGSPGPLEFTGKLRVKLWRRFASCREMARGWGFPVFDGSIPVAD